MNMARFTPYKMNFSTLGEFQPLYTKKIPLFSLRNRGIVEFFSFVTECRKRILPSNP